MSIVDGQTSVTLKTVKFWKYVSLSSNDLIYGALRNKIYASVPSTGGDVGNNVVQIDPNSGRIEQSVFSGSESGQLAISDDYSICMLP